MGSADCLVSGSTVWRGGRDRTFFPILLHGSSEHRPSPISHELAEILSLLSANNIVIDLWGCWFPYAFAVVLNLIFTVWTMYFEISLATLLYAFIFKLGMISHGANGNLLSNHQLKNSAENKIWLNTGSVHTSFLIG